MIIDHMDDMPKFESAYNSIIDDSGLEIAKREIEKYISDVVQNMDKFSEHTRNMFSTEARIKSIDSFREKILRKDYFTKWRGKQQDELVATIYDELPDLIGIRINCYFIEYEKKIYEALKYSLSNDNGFVFNFEENTVQQNGHKIWKFTGRYNKKYNFEIQIKAVMHNVWGEVEHKTVYKNRNYDSLLSSKKTTTETLWDILQASDKQLQNLYNVNDSNEQLLRGMFFNFSAVKMREYYKTNILAEHYKHFFDLFIDGDNLSNSFQERTKNSIKEYVIRNLLDDVYEKEKIHVNTRKETEDLANIVADKYNHYNLEFVYSIANELFEYNEGYEDFLKDLVDMYIPLDMESEDEFVEDYFSDEESEIDSEESALNNDYVIMLDNKIGEVVGYAKS